MSTNDIYDYVTNTIIDLLEKHETEEFSIPWIRIDADNKPARNASSGDNYRGINQLLLSFVSMLSGMPSNQWVAYKQAQSAGGHVRKGEKAWPIIYYKTAFIDNNNKYYKAETVQNMSKATIEAKGIQSIPIMKLYSVFNLTQTEGLEHLREAPEKTPDLNDQFKRHAKAENIMISTGADIRIKESNRAFYSPSGDYITLPLREQFKDVSDFYATAFHELSHWSGAKKRLNRTFGKSFGDKEYAMEELVADISSAFVMASLGETKRISKNASYVSSWLSVMKQNNKAVLQAAQQAQKAADYIQDFKKE